MRCLSNLKAQVLVSFVASVLTSSSPIFSESTLACRFRSWPGYSKHGCFLNRGYQSNNCQTQCAKILLHQVTATNPENAKSAKEDSETILCSYFLKTFLYNTPGNRDKTKMYLVNFPSFDGFCFKNGARAVCRTIGRLTKHKRGAIKTNPAQSRQIQGCCLATRRFCRKAAGSELGRNGRATKDTRGAIKPKPAQTSKIPGPGFRIRACHRKPAGTQIGCQQGWFLRWRLNASLPAPPGGCQQNCGEPGGFPSFFLFVSSSGLRFRPLCP